METIEVEGRLFKYERKNWKWEGYKEYRCVYIPDGRKKEASARLDVDPRGRVNTIVAACSPREARMNYKCVTPNGLAFDYGGSFANFRNLFDISIDDIKRSSRTRKALDSGWQFWRLNHAVFIP